MLAYINVRHAGSGFVVRKLFHGKRVVDLLCADIPERWDLGWTHVSEQNLDVVKDKLRMCDGIFTTFRTCITYSCAKRNENLADLAKEKEIMFDLMCEYEILPLHLEIPRVRDLQLAEINKRFNLSLTTDWVRIPSLMDQ